MRKTLLLVLFLSIPMLVFSEGDETIAPYIPQSGSTDIETKISAEIDAINEEYANDFLAYDALRTDKPNLCRGISGCNNVVKGALESKLWAKGRCNEVTDPIDKKICEGVNNNCSNLSGWKAEFCKAFIANDVNAMSNSFSLRDAKMEFRKKTPTTNDLAWTLALYTGFKYSNPVLCQAILSNSTYPLEERVVCSYVFSSSSGTKDEIIRDLAIVRLSRKENNIKYCDLIKSDFIKNECIAKQ